MSMITSLKAQEVALDVVHTSGTQEQCDKAINAFATKGYTKGADLVIEGKVDGPNKDDGTADFLKFIDSDEDE